MISLQSWTILIFAVFLIHEGTSLRKPSEPSTGRDSSSPTNDNARDPNRETPNHSVERPSNVRGNPTHPDHPELFENQPSSSNSQPAGYEVPENSNSATNAELDAIIERIDTAERILENHRNIDPPVQNNPRPAADNSPRMELMIELVPGSGVLINRNRLRTIMNRRDGSPRELLQRLFEEIFPLREDINHIPMSFLNAAEVFLEQALPHPISHAEFESYVHDLQSRRGMTIAESMPGSGVLINRDRLRTNMDQSNGSPHELRQRLLAELSPHQADINAIPSFTLNVAEVYSRQALSHFERRQQQLRVLEDLLPHQDIDNMSPQALDGVEALLRRSHPMSHAEFRNLFNDFQSIRRMRMIDLIPRSGVRINRNRLERILHMYRDSPLQLQRSLFAELLNLRQNPILRQNVPMGIDDVPLHIRNAVEEFMRINTPGLSRTDFRRNLAMQLRVLRQKNARLRNRSPREQ